MTILEHFRGYEIEMLNGRYVFSDTKEIVADTWRNRPCGHCKKSNTPEGHDGCLGTLPGIMNACCGHGNKSEAYIQYPDKTVLTGFKARKEIRKLKRQIHEQTGN